MKKIYIILVLLMAAHLVAVPVMRMAQKDGRTVYLMGTIHVGKPDLYPLPEAINKAFDASQALALEADLSKGMDQGAQMKMAQMGCYEGDNTLAEKLPLKLYTRALKQAETLGLPQEAMDKMKPWFVAMILTMGQVQAEGFDPKSGLDLHFMEAATQSKKPVVELEGLMYQIEMFNNMPEEQQIQFLTETLDELDKGDNTEELYQAFISGQEDKLNDLLNNTMAKYPELLNTLLVNRNKQMAAKIDEDKNPVLFVAVGAGHMTGENSVPAFMEKNGWKVSIIK